MAKNKYRPDLLEKYGTEEKVEAAIIAYRRSHELTEQQMSSGDWIPIEQLKAVCDEVGITNDGGNSTMVLSIGGDRALENPWHPSLETYYGRGKRWFRESSLTEGIKAILVPRKK